MKVKMIPPKFDKTLDYLNKLKNYDAMRILDKYGKMGVELLSGATPVRTGQTAKSWYYEIEHTKNRYKIKWNNSNISKGAVIAILIQYGHGTRNGGYVQGTDYINPELKKVFEEMSAEIRKEVSSI